MLRSGLQSWGHNLPAGKLLFFVFNLNSFTFCLCVSLGYSLAEALPSYCQTQGGIHYTHEGAGKILLLDIHQTSFYNQLLLFSF